MKHDFMVWLKETNPHLWTILISEGDNMASNDKDEVLIESRKWEANEQTVH